MPEQSAPSASPAEGAEGRSNSASEGWGNPGRSNKYHYFVDTMSLCRKWGFFHGELYQGKDDHSMNCVECKKLLAKRRAGC